MCLSILGELRWWVTIVIVVREVGITVWRLVELRRGNVVPASSGGKLKTLAQSVAISLALLPLWTIVGDWIYWLNWATMAVALVLTVWSGLLYVRDAVQPRARGPRGALGRADAASPTNRGAGDVSAPPGASRLPPHSCICSPTGASRSRRPSR